MGQETKIWTSYQAVVLWAYDHRDVAVACAASLWLNCSAAGAQSGPQPSIPITPGMYDMFSAQTSGAITGHFIVHPNGRNFTIEDGSHAWSGEGQIYADSGSFAWRSTSGPLRLGRGEFKVGADGSWQGRMFGSSINTSFIAKPEQAVAAAANLPLRSSASEARAQAGNNTTSLVPGHYQVIRTDVPGGARSGFTVLLQGQHFTVKGDHLAWFGEGDINGRNGHLNWTIVQGGPTTQRGHSDFIIDSDGTWRGHTLGAGLDYDFIATPERAAGPIPPTTTARSNTAAPRPDKGSTATVTPSNYQDEVNKCAANTDKGAGTVPNDVVISSCTIVLEEISRTHNPLPHEAWYAFAARGEAYWHLKQLKMALADMNEAIRLSPDSYMPWITRAGVNFDLTRYDEAISDANTLLRMVDQTKHPTDLDLATKATALYFRGQSYALKSKYSLAINDYNAALQIFPGMPGVDDAIRQAEQKMAVNSQTEQPPPQAAQLEETRLRCDLIHGHGHCEPVQMLIIDLARRRVYTDPIIGYAQEDDKWLAQGKVKHWAGQNFIERVIVGGDHIRFGMESPPMSVIGDLDLNTGLYDDAQGCVLQCRISRGALIPH